MCLRHRLQPDCLPDAAHGTVEDAAVVDPLLADGMIVAVGAVGHSDLYLVLALLEVFGDIFADGGKTTFVLAHILAVDLNLTDAVDAAAVEQHVLLEISGGQIHGGLVNYHRVGAEPLSHAGKGALYGERNQNFAGAQSGLVVPEAVEVDPLCANHLRTGIFGKDIARVQIFPPFCENMVSRRLPVIGPGGFFAGCCHNQGREKCKIFLHIGFKLSIKNKRLVAKLIFYFQICNCQFSRSARNGRKPQPLPRSQRS